MAVREMAGMLREIRSRIARLERNTVRPMSRRGAGGPAGSIVWSAAASPPDGALAMDGAAVSRATYARLFAAIGTTYGAGDGSTTFNLPNIAGRVIVAQSSDTEFAALGQVGGTKTHTLTSGQIPNLSAASAGAHTHGNAGAGRFLSTDRTSIAKRSGSTYSSGAWVPAVDQANAIESEAATASAGAHTHSVNTGGGGAHNNIQPYIVMNAYIWA